jgi:FkbM family methyltransferase
MTEAETNEFRRRRQFFEAAPAFTPFIGVVDNTGLKFIVQTTDDVVGRGLFLKGARVEFRVLEKALGILEAAGRAKRLNDTTFFDIGANIGTTTVAALRLDHVQRRQHGAGPFKDAVACEPEPTNYGLLKLNVVLNEVADRVRTLPVALSDRTGTTPLHIDPLNSGAHAIPDEGSDGSDSEEIVVEKATIDDLVQRGLVAPDEIGLIWIDVQGHEGHVLAGGGSLFDLGAPVVVEFAPTLLKQSGGQSKLYGAIREHYTHFFDLRQPGAAKPVRRLVKELKEYGQLFQEGKSRSHTDLLVMRLKGSRKAAA